MTDTLKTDTLNIYKAIVTFHENIAMLENADFLASLLTKLEKRLGTAVPAGLQDEIQTGLTSPPTVLHADYRTSEDDDDGYDPEQYPDDLKNEYFTLKYPWKGLEVEVEIVNNLCGIFSEESPCTINVYDRSKPRNKATIIHLTAIPRINSWDEMTKVPDPLRLAALFASA